MVVGGDSMKYTAIYARTSTSYQSKGLEAQINAIQAFCKARGEANVKIYSDAGLSGTKASRPSLDALMGDCRNGLVNTVIVYSFSRFARSTSHLLTALQEFNKLEVKFISVSENLDTNSAIGKALFTIISAISELEREVISERVKNGLQNAKAKGKALGRKKSRNSKLIRELIAQGHSQRKIAKLIGCSRSTIQREMKDVATKPQSQNSTPAA